VVSEQTAATVTDLLVGVTEHGTGKQARVEGFRVAGKTGTAQKVDGRTGRYSVRDRMSSFIGYVPAEDPALVILVVIDTPRRSTYGGVVAAPVFRAVASYGLARRGVLPRGGLPFRVEQTILEKGEKGINPIAATEMAFLPFSPPDIAPGAVPSFVGLSMREALVRAHSEGWEVQVEGSGYVVRQEPPPGTAGDERRLTLHFGTDVS
jgi:cell division protein FtsI (penicillin-binding protein 3)